jgi:hypothetical protein
MVISSLCLLELSNLGGENPLHNTLILRKNKLIIILEKKQHIIKPNPPTNLPKYTERERKKTPQTKKPHFLKLSSKV